MPDTPADPFDLPPHRETFLARYPRKHKLAASGVLLLLALLVSFWPAGSAPETGTAGEKEGGFFSFFGDSGKKLFGGSESDTDIHAPALNDQNDRSVKLAPAPDARVSEDTPEGPLPKISEFGLKPWLIYARPFDLADKRPRIALVLTDLGLSEALTEKVILDTPPTVTLSFSTVGSVVGAWGARARQEGHEFLLQLPVEPYDYPNSDPGPDALLANLSNTENLSRLLRTFRKAAGYIGVTTTYGSSFTSDSTDFTLILQTLQARGLMVLDSRSAPHSVVTEMARNASVPVAIVSQHIDANLAPEEIQAALAELEKTAQRNGRAIGMAAATPLMLSRLQAWMETLPRKGIALAPVSAVAQ